MNQTACCYFNISEQLAGYSVAKASLYFYVNQTPHFSRQNAVRELVVKQVVMNKLNKKPKGYIVWSKKVELNHKNGEWMNVEFTQIVQEWVNYPENNLGIALELKDDMHNNLVVTDVSEDQEKVGLILWSDQPEWVGSQ